MDEESLIQMIAWLANVVTEQHKCRHEAIALHGEACKEHLMMRFPVVQETQVQMSLAQIAKYPTDQEHLRQALKYVLKEVGDRP